MCVQLQYVHISLISRALPSSSPCSTVFDVCCKHSMRAQNRGFWYKCLEGRLKQKPLQGAPISGGLTGNGFS